MSERENKSLNTCVCCQKTNAHLAGRGKILHMPFSADLLKYIFLELHIKVFGGSEWTPEQERAFQDAIRKYPGIPICTDCFVGVANWLERKGVIPGKQTTIQITDAGRNMNVVREDRDMDAQPKDKVPSTHPDYMEKPPTPAEEWGWREIVKTLDSPPGKEGAK